MLQQLIDKQDTFEIVRDRIAVILANEVANQQTLAQGEGKDPDLWKLRVYTERAQSIESFFARPEADASPVVNIWYAGSNMEEAGSNVVERQKVRGTYNIDCFGYASSSNDSAGGHNPGDRESAFALHRAVRLVRNILMSGPYTYLELQGIVWMRWVQSITAFQPEQDGRASENIWAARIVFEVTFSEFSPQIEPVELEQLNVTIKRAEDDQVLAEVLFDYTT